MPATSPSRLLADALAREPGRPLVTYYDHTTGERTELSVATFENWVSKTANLLVDDLGVGPGSRVALLLPLHWQTAVWLAACWAVGVTTCAGGDAGALAASADVAVCGPETLAVAVAAATDEVVALSLLPMSRASASRYRRDTSTTPSRSRPTATGSADLTSRRSPSSTAPS